MFRILLILTTLLLSIDSRGTSLAIVEKDGGTVSFVSIDSGTVERVQVKYLPHEIAVTSTHAYVSNYGHQHVRSSSLKNYPGNTVSMINLVDFSEVETINLGESRCAPHGIEASRDESYVFVTCEGRQEIAMISVRDKKVVKFLRTNQPGSHMLTVGPRDQLFVTNFWIGTVSVIDIDSGKLIKQIYTGRSTEGISLSPDGSFLFVTVVESNEILKISTAKLEIVDRIRLPDGTSPIRILVTADSSKLVVNHSASNTTGLYDASTLELIEEIPVGKQPIGLAISRESNQAYVANMRDGSISVIDIKSNKLVKTLNLGLSSPDGIASLN